MADGVAGPVPRAPAGGVSRGLALLVAGAMFMEILDATVIAPAAPHIAADLAVAAVDINVAITAYVLTLAVLIPVSGWLADRFGARRVFLSAVAIFTLASVGCAAAVDLTSLTGTRVLQGIGGAMMVPVGRLVVLRATPKAQLVTAIAYLTWPALIAPVLAPAVGGLLSTYASWRWIFLINVPLGVAALVLGRRLVPDVRAERPDPLDRWGFALTALGVTALVIGLEALGKPVIDTTTTVIALTLAATVLTAAVLRLLRADRPLLDLRILRIATYRITAAGGSVFRAVITAIPFLLALFFQLGLGWSAAQAGLVVIALFLGNVAVKPVTTPLMRRFGIRAVMLTAILASAACLVGMAFVTAATPLPLLLVLLVGERGVPVGGLHHLQQRRVRRRRTGPHDAREHAQLDAAGARRGHRRRGRRPVRAARRAPGVGRGPGRGRRPAVPGGLRPAGPGPAGAVGRGPAAGPGRGRRRHRPRAASTREEPQPGMTPSGAPPLPPLDGLAVGVDHHRDLVELLL